LSVTKKIKRKPGRFFKKKAKKKKKARTEN